MQSLAWQRIPITWKGFFLVQWMEVLSSDCLNFLCPTFKMACCNTYFYIHKKMCCLYDFDAFVRFVVGSIFLVFSQEQTLCAIWRQRILILVQILLCIVYLYIINDFLRLSLKFLKIITLKCNTCFEFLIWQWSEMLRRKPSPWQLGDMWSNRNVFQIISGMCMRIGWPCQLLWHAKPTTCHLTIP